MPRDKKDTAIFTAYEEEGPFDSSVPEKNLLKAILLSAIADLKKTGETRKKATEFFLSEEDDYIFSFKSICSYLNVDPEIILMVAGLRGNPYDNAPPIKPSEITNKPVTLDN
ncbi:MAG: hypothetical protein D6719_03515 [Candidatus Dadabacteria bacterium]|nr:MAG: hypothetical protein D6719_03515 [Candidatus Dadabacteria bacterium]